MAEDEVEGVAFPIPKPLVERFFSEGKTVFVKPATAWKKLRPGMRFIFYQSREETGFVGEGRIKSLAMANDPLEFFEKYGDKIFLSEDEIKEYKKSTQKWKMTRRRKSDRPKRKWMAIELEDIQRYERPIKPKSPVPVSGRYLKVK
jgi:hypothetical protein